MQENAIQQDAFRYFVDGSAPYVARAEKAG